MAYTLVRHTGFTVGGDLQLGMAVEERYVTPKEAQAVMKAGGLIYNSFNEANDAAHKYNYPPGTEGMIPRVVGGFKHAGKNFPELVFITAESHEASLG